MNRWFRDFRVPGLLKSSKRDCLPLLCLIMNLSVEYQLPMRTSSSSGPAISCERNTLPSSSQAVRGCYCCDKSGSCRIKTPCFATNDRFGESVYLSVRMAGSLAGGIPVCRLAASPPQWENSGRCSPSSRETRRFLSSYPPASSRPVPLPFGAYSHSTLSHTPPLCLSFKLAPASLGRGEVT